MHLHFYLAPGKDAVVFGESTSSTSEDEDSTALTAEGVPQPRQSGVQAQFWQATEPTHPPVAPPLTAFDNCVDLSDAIKKKI
jgi:hypothetical protein